MAFTSIEMDEIGNREEAIVLFQIYGENAGYQLLGWLMVFVGLIVLNELSRRTKKGGIFFFLIVPAALTVYFISIYVGAAMGAEWALNNQTYVHMNSWFHYAKLYAATAGCIGFMMLKYKWSIGKKEWFKVFPFAIVAINILIAVASDFESGYTRCDGGGGDRHPLVALFRECVALRRLVELGQWARRYPQHPLHDRLVGYLLLQKAHRYALAGYDLVLYPCL